MLDGLASTLVGLPREAGRRYRAMGRHRRLAIAAALALFVSPFLPWYGETVVTRGLTGPRSLHVGMTGWQALSGAQVVAVLVAVGVVVGLLARARPGRPSVAADGVAVAAAGALAAVLVLIKMIDHDGAVSTVARTTVAIRWGMAVALVAGVALVWLGVRMARSGREARGGREPGSSREPGGQMPGGVAPASDGEADRAADREAEARIRSRERQRRREAEAAEAEAAEAAAGPRRPPREPERREPERHEPERRELERRD